jgi:hypothetical protein
MKRGTVRSRSFLVVAGLVGILVVATLLWSVPAGAAIASAARARSAGPGILDLPYQDLLVGWLLAAAIGAVGGVVYVGIVGPTRRSPKHED